MTSSKSSLNRKAVVLCAVLAALFACAPARAPRADVPAGGPGLRVAVLPVINLSGTVAPIKEVRQEIVRELGTGGIAVIDEPVLEEFMERHRMRYVGGIDRETGGALKQETAADAVLITSLELYSILFPPKVALTSRLVSTAAGGVLWMDGEALTGDASPGILGLGLIDDPGVLVDKAVRSLVGSLRERLAGTGAARPAGTRFRPKTLFRSPVLSTDMKYRVAVLPFVNRSLRKNAGELMSLRFMGALAGNRSFELVDPGEVRMELLRYRIIMEQGVSISDADILFHAVDADLILTGTVYVYEDYEGTYGKPKVEFSVQLLEKKSREVVWSSESHNEGDEGVFFFDIGRVYTAQTMAADMARQVVGLITQQ